MDWIRFDGADPLPHHHVTTVTETHYLYFGGCQDLLHCLKAPNGRSKLLAVEGVGDGQLH